MIYVLCTFLRAMPGISAKAGLLPVLLVCFSQAAAQPSGQGDGEPDVEPLMVEGIAPLTGDDDPRVLYILPWEPPTTPRRPRAELVDEAPGLLQPEDPWVLEYHRHFRETLNPYQDSNLSLQ